MTELEKQEHDLEGCIGITYAAILMTIICGIVIFFLKMC